MSGLRIEFKKQQNSEEITKLVEQGFDKALTELVLEKIWTQAAWDASAATRAKDPNRAKGHPEEGKMPIASWSSKGGKWRAELHSDKGGYTLREFKNGSGIGSSFRPKGYESEHTGDKLNDDGSAAAHFDAHVKNSFDTPMKREDA